MTTLTIVESTRVSAAFDFTFVFSACPRKTVSHMQVCTQTDQSWPLNTAPTRMQTQCLTLSNHPSFLALIAVHSTILTIGFLYLHPIRPSPIESKPKKDIMPYDTRRRSTLHMTAEATLGFKMDIGIARRISHTQRPERFPPAPYYKTIIRKPSATNSNHNHHHHHYNTRRFSIFTPHEPSYTSLHAYCLSTDASYARLSDRLDRLRGYRAATAYCAGGKKGRASGLEGVLVFLQERVGKLERTLEGMRERIGSGREDGWDGSGRPFRVGGRWVEFL